MFNRSADKQNIRTLKISENNIEKEYKVPAECSEPFKRRCRLKISVENYRGSFSLTVIYQNGQSLSLPNIKYKRGKTNYVRRDEGKLRYVKAHWK